MPKENLERLARLIRHSIITSTTAAGSGHATSSLSAVELMTVLFFNGFLKADLHKPHDLSNDRFILSKGHASPLLYALYHAAGVLSAEDLMKLRTMGSPLQGHPSVEFPYVDVATGSLGQGLSVGLGMSLGLKLRMESGKLKVENSQLSTLNSQLRVPRVFVLLGDSEMAEGQVWEAIQLAAHYKVHNLIGIIDVNRLGQRGETMLGWDTGAYARRVASFGWNTITVGDGHDIEQVQKAYEIATGGRAEPRQGGASFGEEERGQAPSRQQWNNEAPTMIIAKTVKGKGVSFLENKDGWHGKPLPKDKLQAALKELGEIDLKARGEVAQPFAVHSSQFTVEKENQEQSAVNSEPRTYNRGELVSTREAYGDALAALGQENPLVVALDGEVSNSTMSEKFKEAFPERFFEMFIAEQNMISAALGLSKLGFIPFASTFACFLTRAHDQIRMSQYCAANLKIVGSHAGVSIGEDGPSQMGLEDISMMRNIAGSTIFYPSDGVSTAACTKLMAANVGIYYLRTNRPKTPVIYQNSENFNIAGSKVLKQSDSDKAVVFAAGITVHEALKAHELLQKEGINIRIVDLYCVKPLDTETVKQCSNEVKHVIVVEDHYPEGGLGEAVLSALSAQKLEARSTKLETNSNDQNSSRHGGIDIRISNLRFTHLAVKRIPRSGKSEELLAYEQIDAAAIIKAVKEE